MGDKLHSVLGKAARIVMLIYLIFPASVGHVIHLRSPNIYPRSFCSLTEYESCKMTISRNILYEIVRG